MTHPSLRPAFVAAAAALCSLVVACGGSDNNSTGTITKSTFTVANLVADATATTATTVDANLINPWGVAFGPTGILWVANNGTGTSTLYDATGVKQALVVTIPSPSAATGGKPTGTIFNSTTDFKVGATPAAFLFAGEDGVISGWVPNTTAAAVAANRSSNDAVYKGLAIAANAGANFLFATNFKKDQIDVFDASFAFVKSFTDTSIPSGYGPFGIQNIGGLLYVTFAQQLAPDNEDDVPGAGKGFVVVFNPDGTVAKRFASNGNLNAPWAIAQAPAVWGDIGGAILIGNFGDGKIGAYNATSGAFMGFLTTDGSNALTIDGLWGLTFGPGANVTTLYFAAGPGDEAHGLVGTIKVNP